MTYSNFPHDAGSIDMLQNIALSKNWQMDRKNDDRIDLFISGQWRPYPITVAWDSSRKILYFYATMVVEPKNERVKYLLETLNKVNDMTWVGSFTHQEDIGVVSLRYALVLDEESSANHLQIEKIISELVNSCDRYYPTFQLVAHEDIPVDIAIAVAIDKTCGRA